MRSVQLIAIGLSSLTILSSCSFDEDMVDCPPLKLNLVVIDKNYSNIDQVRWERRLSDTLAFREYVPTLAYRLERINNDGSSSLVTYQPMTTVGNDDKVQAISFDFGPDLLWGKYVLTVLGGGKDNRYIF